MSKSIKPKEGEGKSGKRQFIDYLVLAETNRDILTIRFGNRALKRVGLSYKELSVS